LVNYSNIVLTTVKSKYSTLSKGCQELIQNWLKSGEDIKMIGMAEGVTSITFTDWLKEEMDKRQWKPSDLAERAGVTDAALSRILTKGDRQPGPELCKKIAKALGEPAEKVFRLAGLLPGEEERSDGVSGFEMAFLGWLRQLPDSRQEAVLEVVKGMVISRAQQA
jgi:transcriptional regulator with XRE-family HTH domain